MFIVGALKIVGHLLNEKLYFVERTRRSLAETSGGRKPEATRRGRSPDEGRGRETPTRTRETQTRRRDQTPTRTTKTSRGRT